MLGIALRLLDLRVLELQAAKEILAEIIVSGSLMRLMVQAGGMSMLIDNCKA